MDDDYKSFLQSLDNSQLLSHISSLSQSQEKSVDKNKDLTSSDAFDDSFNEYLTRKVPSLPNFSEKQVDTVNNEDNDVKQPLEPYDDLAEDAVLPEELAEDHEVLPDHEIIEDSDIGPMHGFGDYGIYFDNKHRKQQLEDQNYIKWDKTRRILQGEDSYREPIFRNCIIFVNGNTVPSMNEIHRLVIIHGGKFLTYLGAKRNATHIICDRLTPRKQVEFKNCQVVKSKWIVDCIESGTLLDWKPYRLFKEIAYDQTRLPETINEFANEQFYMEDDDHLLHEDSIDEEEEEVEDDKTSIPNQEKNYQQKKANIPDATHPDFLNKFFSKSRLHLLSTWKADLKLKFLKKIPKSNRSSVTKITKIAHIDFDCFFATASCQNTTYNINTDPIAVSHGISASDVASCNYVARKFGVRNGMWVSSAKKLCPDLILIPYDFKIYEKYANELYNYLISLNLDIYPISIDEAMIDLSSYKGSINEWCERARQDLYKLTHCTISIGIGSNVLLAKLALRKAKPNGYYILDSNLQEFLSSISVRDLPGVGRSIVDKISHETGIESPIISDLYKISKEKLIKIFGPKTGSKLYDYARGIDTSKLEQEVERKSVSVDVNFGIRFENHHQLETFLSRLSTEISKRLINLNVVGSQVTLKLAKRAANAPINPPKYMGMGRCDFFNKSAKLGLPTNNPGVISSELKSLARILSIPPSELRGIAVTISKLEDSDEIKKNRQMKLSHRITKAPTRLKKVDNSTFIEPIDDAIDWEVFESLPWDIKREIQSELARRGLSRPSPKPSATSSPSKGNGKAYLQQLLPTNTTQEPKYMRVIESPKRLTSPKKKSRANSPQKSAFYPDTSDLSYDSSVLNELPSSIKNEVIEDLESRKRFKQESLKSKFIKSVEKSKLAHQPITLEWINNQPKLNPVPIFQGGNINEMIQGWIKSSLDQDGPHMDDASLFIEYCKQLTSDRIIRLKRVIVLEIEHYRSIEAVLSSKKYEIALNEWDEIIKKINELTDPSIT